MRMNFARFSALPLLFTLQICLQINIVNLLNSLRRIARVQMQEFCCRKSMVKRKPCINQSILLQYGVSLGNFAVCRALRLMVVLVI